MLGGFAKISPTDIEGSSKLLKQILKTEEGPGAERALDCGAGIGRITKHLLTRHFQTVDLGWLQSRLKNWLWCYHWFVAEKILNFKFCQVNLKTAFFPLFQRQASFFSSLSSVLLLLLHYLLEHNTMLTNISWRKLMIVWDGWYLFFFILVEQDEHFLEKAREYLSGNPRVGTLYCAGLQNFQFKPETYDVIWCQWVLGHLTDDHLVGTRRRGGVYKILSRFLFIIQF